jgi:hypothetical protein
MTAILLLSTFLAVQAQSQPAPAFKPRLTFKLQPPPSSVSVRRGLDDREVICGMVVVRKSPDDDPNILLPARETGAVIRRIEPQACTPRTAVPAK